MDRFKANIFQHGVEAGLLENLVVVADHAIGLDAVVLGPHGDISDLLFQPGLVGIAGGGGIVDATRSYMKDHEHHGVQRPAPSPDTLVEKVAGQQGFGVHGEELAPGDNRLLPRPFDRLGWIELAVAFEDSFNGHAGNHVTQLPEFAKNARVAPGGVFPLHPKGQFGNFAPGGFSTYLAGFFSGGFLAKPALVGARGDDGDMVVDGMAELGPQVE